MNFLKRWWNNDIQEAYSNKKMCKKSTEIAESNGIVRANMEHKWYRKTRKSIKGYRRRIHHSQLQTNLNRVGTNPHERGRCRRAEIIHGSRRVHADSEKEEGLFYGRIRQPLSYRVLKGLQLDLLINVHNQLSYVVWKNKTISDRCGEGTSWYLSKSLTKIQATTAQKEE